MNARFPVRGRVDVPAIAVAVLATVMSFAAVFSWFDPLAYTDRASTRMEQSSRSERVVFVAASGARDTVSRTAVLPRAKDRRAGPSLRSGRQSVELISAPAEAVPPSVAPPARSGSPSLAPPRRQPVPFITRPKPWNPFVRLSDLSKEERDSILGELHDAVPIFAATRIPTQEEKDSVLRQKSQPGTIPGRKAGEQPPTSGGGGGGSVGLPLFSAGPSRAERVRDSAANAEYLRVLARLQDRVRAKRESIRVADSIAGRRGGRP